MMRKAFSSFVSFLTILWSVGAGALAFPVTAQAATLNAGDLIKASGPAVYFYADNGMRYVFPNEKTYFSWFNDFSSVMTITDAELAAIPIGGNVTIRPGTKLVKIQTDPKTYAVTNCGTLHWIESETIAKDLYGDAWATRVVDVPDSFFVNYTIGSSISTSVHPNGQLITYAGDTNRYVVWDGMKRTIDGDVAFNANHWNMVNAVETTITYTNGANVTGAEMANFWQVACGGTTPVGGDVTVSLASDTPAGATVPYNAMGVPMIKVNVQAGSADAMLAGMHFHRVGVGDPSDFDNLYLYDELGNRLSSGRSVNSSSNIVEFNALNQTIPANGMKSYYVYADFSSPMNTGGNHAFELADAASVVLSGSGTVSGSFPVRGNVFVVGTAAAGQLEILPGPTPANPVVGTMGAPIASFKLTASTNDIYVHRVALYQGGTVDNSDLSNFELYQGTTKVGASASVNSKGQIVLNFSTPYLIPDGVTRVFELRADVKGRSARTIDTYVEYAADIYAIDSVYNSGASIKIDQFDTAKGGLCTGTGEGSCVVTQGGNLTFAFNGPPTANVAKGSLGVVLYKFSLTSSDNDLEVRNMMVRIDADSGGDVIGSAGTKYFRNVKIKDLDTDQTVMGPKEATGANGVGFSEFDYSDSFYVMAGETRNLAVVADLANSEDAGGEFIDEDYKVTWFAFATGDVKVVDTGESLDITKIVPNANTVGNTMTVKASSLIASLASTPSSGTIVKKSVNKPVAGIALEAGAESDIKVTNLTLACQATENDPAPLDYQAGLCSKFITSLSLWDGDTQVGNARTPDTVDGEAPISNMNLDIPAGTTKNLTVKATFSSLASGPGNFDYVSVGAVDITAQDEDANTITPVIEDNLDVDQLNDTPPVNHKIVPEGVLTVADYDLPVSDIVVAGTGVWVPFARYKATAQFEDINIERIAVTSTVGGDNADFEMVGVGLDGTLLGSATFQLGQTGMTNVELTEDIVVPKGGNEVFELWAKLAPTKPSSEAAGWYGSSRSGHEPGLAILEDYNLGVWTNYGGYMNVRALGSESGDLIYADPGADWGNSMVLRKAKPVVTPQPLTNDTLSSGLSELYRMQIGADGQIAVKQIVFEVILDEGGTNLELSDFRLYKGSAVIPVDQYYIVDETGALDLEDADTLSGSGTYYVVVSMYSELSLSGAGNVYSLYAMVDETGDNNKVTTSLLRGLSSDVVTGYLVNDDTNTVLLGSSAEIFNIDTDETYDGVADYDGTFVWSDYSENPHDSDIDTSRDWTNDLYVDNLTFKQSLSD